MCCRAGQEGPEPHGSAVRMFFRASYQAHSRGTAQKVLRVHPRCRAENCSVGSRLPYRFPFPSGRIPSASAPLNARWTASAMRR